MTQLANTRPHQLHWGDRKMGLSYARKTAVRRLALHIWYTGTIQAIISLQHHTVLACCYNKYFPFISAYLVWLTTESKNASKYWTSSFSSILSLLCMTWRSWQQWLVILSARYQCANSFTFALYILLTGVISVLFLLDEGDHSIIETLQ